MYYIFSWYAKRNHNNNHRKDRKTLLCNERTIRHRRVSRRIHGILLSVKLKSLLHNLVDVGAGSIAIRVDAMRGAAHMPFARKLAYSRYIYVNPRQQRHYARHGYIARDFLAVLFLNFIDTLLFRLAFAASGFIEPYGIFAVVFTLFNAPFVDGILTHTAMSILNFLVYLRYFIAKRGSIKHTSL